MELKQGDYRSKWIVHSNHNIKCFTEGEIERMTSNYKTILGRGAFGEVYRGVLEDNHVVAVKKFVHNVREDFDQELTVHREINHKNVVRLIGYCLEENALMMVTEYIPNGNLNAILHSNNSIPISLETRLRVATECAEALSYMHSYMYTQVIHGDIKPANILLDGRFRAKISDFGISRLVNDPDKTLFTKHVMGSIGYMDPLFARDGRLTVKSDVYSFGVVLLELISRRRVTTSGGEANIVDVFTNALATGVRGLREIFDAEIASQNNMKILEGVAKLAGECMRMERARRPEMKDVVERLRKLGRPSQQGRQLADLFSWARKSKPVVSNSRSMILKPTPAAQVRTTLDLKNEKVTTTLDLKNEEVTTTLPSDLCRRFSLEEIKAATRNFDESLLVNADVFGRRVYCGEIDGEATNKVNIKCLVILCHVFPSWIKTMSKLSHGHILPLIGYCDEHSLVILVYDFMSRGSLHHHLYENEESCLTWKQRLEICVGAARGLHYLHRGTEHAIFHGKLDSVNIFLDENWVPKIMIDCGLFDYARARWARGFICGFQPDISRRDPVTLVESGPTEKSDVHAFGTLLFQVMSDNRILPKGYMLGWALRYKEKGKLHQFLGPALKGEVNPQSLNKFAETAAKCVANRGIHRPSMEHVISDLECALQLQLDAEARSGSGSQSNL